MIEIKIYANEKLILDDLEVASTLHGNDFINGKALHLLTYPEIIIYDANGVPTQYYKHVSKNLRPFFNEFDKHDARRVFYSKHKSIPAFIRKTKISKLLK